MPLITKCCSIYIYISTEQRQLGASRIEAINDSKLFVVVFQGPRLGLTAECTFICFDT